MCELTDVKQDCLSNNLYFILMTRFFIINIYFTLSLHIAALRIFNVLHNSTLDKRRLDGRQIVVDVVACLLQYPIDLPFLSFIRVYFVQRSTKTRYMTFDAITG